MRLARRLRRGLERLAVPMAGAEAQIVPCLVPGAARVMAVSEELLSAGVFVQGLRPPTVEPGMERLRFTATASHTERHVDTALERAAPVLARARSNDRGDQWATANR